MEYQSIKNLDSPALISMIDYWEDYESYDVVLIAYAELKYRNYKFFNKFLNKKLNEFSLKFNHNDINSFLTAFLLKNDCNNYEEFLLKYNIVDKGDDISNNSKTGNLVKKVDNRYDDYDVKDVLIEILKAEKKSAEKLELVRQNTAKLVWWLVAIPIIIGVLFAILNI